MGWLIICIVLWIVISVIISLNKNNDTDDKIQYVWGAFFWIAILGGITQIVAFVVISSGHEKITYEPLYIESAFMDKNWSVSGSFIIGTGGFSGGSYSEYIVYGKFDKGMKRVELDTYDTYIQEKSSVRPQIKNYWQEITDESWEHWLWFGSSETCIQYRIHNSNLIMIVPPNTVYKNFELK